MFKIYSRTLNSLSRPWLHMLI